ncbi:MAG: cupin domain-containing protein [Acidobacteriaceae bacterium]
MRRILYTVAFGIGLAISSAASPLFAQSMDQVKVAFEHALPNTPGKKMVAVVVTYPPGGKSASHHHAPSAFIYAYVLSGAIRSQVDGQPPTVYQAGEGFYEVPGSHHKISENVSQTTPASLLAIFEVDSKDRFLTTPDQNQPSRHDLSQRRKNER